MPVDPHADDPVAANPTTADTSVALSNIKSDQGAQALSDLSVALDKLSDSIAKTIDAESNLLGELVVNKGAIEQISAIKTEVKSADVDDAVKTINTILGGVITTDTIKLQDAAFLASTAPDPIAMTTFSTKMISHIMALSQSRIADLGVAMADVNGFKVTVDQT